ncbi:hypothetical protein LCGC14_1765580 [marine sediment metagenome]|uniref:Uncharacterized protein n=1 Tax=marine sediment metagenome TaxID=412755 RepID=A0A0F9GZU1_9ZZZZ
MLEIYTGFMIFEVRDNGEHFKLEINEDKFSHNNGDIVLHPLHVVIIVKEELRRIFIWKGVSSSVRKKFIASRVASEVQRELMNSSVFHRCKIVSVDQGDEPEEFLDAFGFQKIPIKFEPEEPKIPFMTETGQIPTSLNQNIELKTVKVEKKPKKKRVSEEKKQPSYERLKKDQKLKGILNDVLKIDVPENFKRKNILIGNSKLYGMVTRKAEFFSEVVEEREWGNISNISKDIFELEGHKLRIHFNKGLGEIEAIEILEKIPSVKKPNTTDIVDDYKKWTVKQLRQFCHDKSIKIPASFRKAEIIRLIVDFNASN